MAQLAQNQNELLLKMIVVNKSNVCQQKIQYCHKIDDKKIQSQ